MNQLKELYELNKLNNLKNSMNSVDQIIQSQQALNHEPIAVRWWDLGLLIVVGIPFLFWGLGLVSFLDPDEGLYGSIAREMAVGRDWITPHFNGVRYLEKPPLQFWLSALTIVFFGPSEWSVRLWSALPAFGTALLIWRMGVWLYGRSAGLLGAIVFMTSIGVFRYVRVAATDFLLVFSLTLAIYGFLKAYLSGAGGQSQGGSGHGLILNGQPPIDGHPHVSRNTGLLLFYLGMALGVLSKGFIGIVFPLMIVGLFLLLANSKWQMESRNSSTVNGQWGLSRTIDYLRLTLMSGLGRTFTKIYSLFANRYSLIGLVLFLIIVLPWHILAAWENPGFFQFYIIDNQILRFLNNRAFLEDDVPIRTLSFLAVTLIWFFPWSLILPATIRQGFPRFYHEMSLNESARLLVGIWGLGILAFFCLSLSKLEHYSLPAIPAFSLMVGGRWGQAITSRVKGQWKMANGKWQIVNSLRSAINRKRDGLSWCLAVGAVGCIVVGAAILFFDDLLTPNALLAGLAELNVYYRILMEQGVVLPFASVVPIVNLIKGLAVVLLISLPMSFIFFQFRMPKASFLSAVGLAVVVAVLVFKLILVIEPHHSSKWVAEALTHPSGNNSTIIHEGSLEYSAGLPFYTRKRIYVLNGKRGDLEFGSRYIEARYLFLDHESFAHLWNSRKRIYLVTRPQMQKSIIETLSADKMFPLGHYGPRWLYTNLPIVNSQWLLANSE